MSVIPQLATIQRNNLQCRSMFEECVQKWEQSSRISFHLDRSMVLCFIQMVKYCNSIKFSFIKQDPLKETYREIRQRKQTVCFQSEKFQC